MSYIKYLRQSEVSRFFAVITDARDLLLFGTIYHYGLRVVEATLLKLSDIDLEHQTIFIKRVKGGHGGQRPLLSNTASLLIRYLPKRRLTSEALFTGRQGSLSRRRIQQLFKDYAQKAGLEAKYSVHSLRHSIATHLLDAGIDIADVRDHLGHVNIQNTLVYAQLTDKRRIEFFRKVEASGEIVKI